MQKVMYKKWNGKEYSIKTKYEREPDCFQEDFVNAGLFHQWGMEHSKEGSYTVALVQNYKGEIECVLPKNIKFID